ncbi:uncharacterized protein PRCAT00003813001 [Priceomyces carsonii]|uniref:uncharacterized protein n=1 Tax=Priceomyces carsonii TaxID=28549 RepID=UPI002ED80631|nr:unnamed protein product [Priceomyces carsonii]
MLKRTLGYIWKTENSKISSTMPDYEKWSKNQLIEKIRELELDVETKEGTTDVLEEPLKKKAKTKSFDFSKHNKRFIALRFAYLGWNYNGLSFQYEPTPLPTVEDEILRAMEKARLIPKAEPGSCKFSRCGRTDKGVSAMNQVISLEVRSNLTTSEQNERSNDLKELPYISVLNSLLPSDIRITGICLRPPEGFDARFSCTFRHYRYFFKKDNLDIDLMKEASKKYEGVHDFRNFCKLDGSKQITNYKREVLASNILPFNDEFYMFDLRGTAFLWHQVRCMVAILFMVGQKLEKPLIIDELLDPELYPRKPNYDMANDIPLVLYDCKYPPMEWLTIQNDFAQKSKLLTHYSNFKQLAIDYKLKSNIVGIMEDMFIKDVELKLTPGSGAINIGDGKGRNFRKYVPMAKREMGDSFEEVNARYREKKAKSSKAPNSST